LRRLRGTVGGFPGGGEAGPKLLEIRCRAIDQMRMVNALCRFVEDAE